jgi:hypothetical protein
MSGNIGNTDGPLGRSGPAWRAWLLGWVCGVTVVAMVYILLR